MLMEAAGLMNRTEYDADTKVAKIQGGSLWQDVYSTLVSPNFQDIDLVCIVHRG